MSRRFARALAIPIFAALGGLATALPAYADTSLALDPVSVWLGAYYPDTKVDLSVRDRAANLDSGKLNFDAGNATLPRARVDVLLFGTQGLSFDYYRFERDRTQTLSDPFSIGGNVIDPGASIRGKFTLDIGNASYRWWFGGDSDVFGVGVGAAYYKVKAGVSAQADVNGTGYSAAYGYSDDAVAPLVTLGFRHAFSDALRVYLDASGVKKNGGNLSGHIYNAALGVEWFPWHNIGIGAEYAATRVSLDARRSNLDADLDLKLHGPAAYLRMRF